jgi:hypothetical protein
VSVNALCGPGREMLLDQAGGDAGLETEGVTAEVDAGFGGRVGGGLVLGSCCWPF